MYKGGVESRRDLEILDLERQVSEYLPHGIGVVYAIG